MSRRALAAAVVLTLSVATAVACGETANTASGPSDPTTTVAAPLVTSPPRPDVVADLTQPGIHDLPLPPLPGRNNFEYFPAGDQVLAWGANRRSGPEDWGNFEPIDQGALLDPTTMSWTVLPPIGFEFPTANARPTWVSGHIVVVGNSCDVTAHESVGTGVANCAPGPIQAATYDPTSRRWTPIRAPASVSGFVVKVLPVGANLVVDALPPSTNVDRFALLDPTARTWRIVGPPATGKPDVLCGSHGVAFAVNIRVKTPTGWIELEDTNSLGGPDLYGQVQVSTLGPGDSAWSAPTQPTSNDPTSSVAVGCVGGGVLDAAQGLPGGRFGGTVLFAVAKAPWAPAASLPTDFEPLGVGSSAMVTALSGDRLAIDGQYGRREVFDGSTRRWSSPPLQLDAMDIGVSLGSGYLARNDNNGGLVAVTP